MKTWARLLIVFVVAAGLSAALLWGFRALQGAGSEKARNPYEYDVKQFRAVAPALIGFDEAEPLAVSDGELKALAVGADDTVFVAVGSAIEVLDPGGQRTRRLELSAPVGCLAVDAEGTLYVGHKEHVAVLGPTGEERAEWVGLGEKAVITSIALVGDEVFLADAGHRLVWRFDRSGRLLGQIGERDSEAGRPGFIVPSPHFDVAPSADGTVWVVNPGLRRVENYAADGVRREAWGQSSMAIDGFSGCCNPTDIAIAGDGSFFTSEKGLVRVKRYDRHGALIGVVAGPDAFDEDTTGLDLAVDSAGRVLVLDPSRRKVRVFVARDRAPAETD